MHFTMPKPKVCCLCGTKEQFATVGKGTYLEKQVPNFPPMVKGLDICISCEDTVQRDAIRRNKRVRKLGLIGKPLSHPNWGKFLDWRRGLTK